MPLCLSAMNKVLKRHPAAPHHGPARIVIVDDSPDVLHALCRFLSTQPLVEIVGIARDGVDGVEQVERHQPDLVVMDLQMPRLNGLAATVILRQRFPHIPIVLMSVHDDEGTMEVCLTHGADAFVSKLKLTSDLLPQIERLMSIDTPEKSPGRSIETHA